MMRRATSPRLAMTSFLKSMQGTEPGKDVEWKIGWSGRRESNPRDYLGRVVLYH